MPRFIVQADFKVWIHGDDARRYNWVVWRDGEVYARNSARSKEGAEDAVILILSNAIRGE